MSYDIADEQLTDDDREDINEPIYYFSKYVEPKTPMSAEPSLESTELSKWYKKKE